MNSPPPSYSGEFARIHSDSPYSHNYQSISSSSASPLHSYFPLPLRNDSDRTVSPNITPHNLHHSCSSTEQTHELILPPPYPSNVNERTSQRTSSPSETLLSNSTIILAVEEHRSIGDGLTSQGATFYYTSVITIFKVFIFIFHITNIIIAAINFHDCPYKVGHLLNFIPITILFIHCFGVFYLAIKLWNAWMKLCNNSQTEQDALRIQDKLFWFLDKLYLFEVLLFLPLYTLLLLSHTLLFMFSSPDFLCDRCTQFCDSFFFKFSSVTSVIYAVLGVMVCCLSYFLIILRFCSRGLVQVTKLFFCKSDHGLSN